MPRGYCRDNALVSTDRAVRDHTVAVAWGAAEATVFFLVPDVWLSRVALTSPRRAFVACGTAVAGALAGGAATYVWARRVDPEASRAALRRIPAISGEMVDRCLAEVEESGNRVLLTGPAKGVPYKLYAWAAGVAGTSLPGFLAWSVPGRVPRFVAVTALTALLQEQAERRLGTELTQRLAPASHALAWIAFYSWYLNAVGQEE